MREEDVEAATRTLLRSRPGPPRPMAKSRLTHFDEAGAARMVDVSDKPATAARAVAAGSWRWRRRHWR